MAGSKKKKSKKKKDFGGYSAQDVEEFAAHAAQIKKLASGEDIVETAAKVDATEKRPAAFDRDQLQVVRSWTRSRPLEPTHPASALIEYPRMWTTNRGRYAKFSLPGSGSYGILRARPTF